MHLLSGEDDDRNAREGWIGELGSTKRPAVHDGHVQIEQDDIGYPTAAQVRERYLTIAGFNRGKPVEPQESCERPANGVVVIHDQHSVHVPSIRHEKQRAHVVRRVSSTGREQERRRGGARARSFEDVSGPSALASKAIKSDHYTTRMRVTIGLWS